jgi:hypothetical protein
MEPAKTSTINFKTASEIDLIDALFSSELLLKQVQDQIVYIKSELFNRIKTSKDSK